MALVIISLIKYEISEVTIISARMTNSQTIRVAQIRGLLANARARNAIRAKVVWVSQRNRDTTGIITPDPSVADAGAVLNGIAYDAVTDTFLLTGKRCLSAGQFCSMLFRNAFLAAFFSLLLGHVERALQAPGQLPRRGLAITVLPHQTGRSVQYEGLSLLPVVDA